MTETTKEMESRTWEQLPEVYGLAVILVICVIGGGETRGTISNQAVIWSQPIFAIAGKSP